MGGGGGGGGANFDGHHGEGAGEGYLTVPLLPSRPASYHWGLHGAVAAVLCPRSQHFLHLRRYKTTLESLQCNSLQFTHLSGT